MDLLISEIFKNEMIAVEVAGVKNIDSRIEDEIEVVTVEVRGVPKIQL